MSLVRHRNAWASYTLAVALLFAPVLLWCADIPPEGQPIVQILFPPDQPLDPQELGDILEEQGIKKGAKFSQAAVRAAIQRLFRTGRFADIQVNAEPSESGVVLQFLTKNAWFIGHVGVEGNVSDSPNPGQLANAAGLELGTPFNAADLEAADARVLRLLIANGFYDAEVAHRVDYLDIAQQVNITFRVDSGKRARYTTPQIDGTDLILSVKNIIKATGWHRFLVPGWRSVTQKRTSEGVRKVRLRYDKAGRLLATVELSGMEYDELKRELKPALNIKAGPKVEVKTIGHKIRSGKLKNNVPIYEEHTVDRDLLQEGANNLRDVLQASGYFDAVVEYRQRPITGDKEEIDYVINAGKRHRFVKLDIEGNQYFTLKTLRERMFLQPKSFQFRRGRFSNAFLKRDVESISNLYRANGFRDVSITTSEIDDYRGKAGDLAITMKINEGKQWIVAHLDVTGYEKLDLHRIIGTLNSSDDQPFSEFNIAADRELILNYYFENGFPDAQFSWTSNPASRPNLVNLSYTLVEGKQQFVRQVYYSGIRATKPRLVNRQITLNPNDPLSPVAMSDTQRRLYDLGIFAKVDMAIQNPDGDTTRKYVVYDMEEASRWSITGGFGAEIARIGGSSTQQDLSNPGGATGFSPRVLFDVSRLNFLGLGQTLSFRTRYSSLQKQALISYLAPHFLNQRNYDFTASIFYNNSFDVRTFASKRLEGSVQLADRISRSLTALFRFSYRQVNVSNLKIDPLLAPTLAQSERTGILSANLVQDRRDDPTDAHKGIFNSLDVGLAGHFFGGNTNFLRILAKNATYTRIGDKLVFARQTSFGIMPAFNITIPPNSADPDPIPLAERFYGGGTDTLRAFPQNQAGPRDLQTGFPLGGSAFFFNNTELRFPLIGESIGGVIFEDFGNVFARPGDITFRFTQPHPENPTDFNYMVHAVGVGVRYRTPIGPVRVDLAYGLNSPRFNGFSGSFSDLLNCTAANNCTFAPQQINRFQFFFSIGQTF